MRLLTPEEARTAVRQAITRGLRADEELLKAQALLTRKETLKEVGAWLKGRSPKTCDPDIYFHLLIHAIEIDMLLRGEMP